MGHRHVVVFVIGCLLNLFANGKEATKEPITCGTNEELSVSGDVEIESVSANCKTKNIWIFIDLATPVIVHEVVVWQGNCSGCIVGSLDFFRVTLNGSEMVRDFSYKTYPNLATIDTPMRVIFSVIHGLKSSGIIIENRVRKNIRTSITFVQVKNFDKSIRIFHGCFKLFYETHIEFRVPIKTCKWKCSKLSYHLFSHHGGHCQCSDKEPFMPSTVQHCIDLCPNDTSNYCEKTNAVYSTVYLAHPAVPEFLGCYNKYPLRFIKKFDEGINTPYHCIRYCGNNRKKFAFLWGNDICFCDNKLRIDKLTADPAKCNIPCSKDSPKMCGGQDFYSVYSTCHNGLGHDFCHVISRCIDGEIDEFGVCPLGCTNGWMGDRCIEHVMPETYVAFKEFTTAAPEPHFLDNVFVRLGFVSIGVLIGLILVIGLKTAISKSRN